jgi:hypothetical protein
VRSDTTVSPLHALTEDSSAKFWSVYISEAEHYDSALVESWKADMEGMLIFVSQDLHWRVWTHPFLLNNSRACSRRV